MHPFHVFVSLLNLACGIAATILIASPPKSNPTFATFAVFGGYWANALAVIVAFVLIILLAVRTANGNARPLISRHWLGLFNGAFVVVFWSGVMLLGKLS